MIPSISPSVNLFLNNLSQLQSTITAATTQLSSGYQINQPSDAPDQISPLLQLQASLSHNQAVAGNLASVQASVTSGDQAVSSAIQLLDQAESLGAQGAGTTVSASTRTSLAQQVESLQEQMVALANTQVRGQYVFGGDRGNTQPYTLDLNQAATVPQNGVDRLQTLPVTATRQIEVSDHSFIAVDQTAQTLFDHRNADDSLASDNVFAALNGLRVALSDNTNPNQQAEITTAQTSVQAASAYLNSQETFYGNVENRLTAATDRLTTENTNLQQQISAVRDANVAQLALELTAAENQNQASLAAEGKAPNTSLFDFLG